MEEIIWSSRARNDAKVIHEYIALDSKYYANKWLDRIAARISVLPKHPYIGRVVPEKKDDNIREVFLGKYRIMYSLKQLPQIVVYRIIHSTRMFNE